MSAAQQSVAVLFPARTQSDGRAWYRPVRPPGADMSQWAWTSDPRLAHPDYCAHYDEQTGGLHPEGLCGGDCSGCVGEGEGGPLRTVAALVEAATAPVVSVAAARAEVFGAAWSQVVELASAIESEGTLW
ncbi:hypothetical protein SEA_CHRIS_80 [Mycobacterium phage Chris]|uniref:Uncharacterized protein n=1 Tax=Mycobacterium phage Chris TaxID=2725626 RepID=A0A6M3SZP7_9CAUD|nr:hypothetical protein I5G96_gp025 [Mycobacterium phage Chris]QJD50482.1 hypothetical protein SEA_CHRIS_80 [Mycobacterium phage Chris]